MLAPNFTSVATFNDSFFKIKLSNYRNKKNIVLFFYNHNSSTLEQLAHRTKLFLMFEKLLLNDVQVFGISVDSRFVQLSLLVQYRKKYGQDLPYPLISDFGKKICYDYTTLDEDGKALDSLIIIDKKGRIRYILKENDLDNQEVITIKSCMATKTLKTKNSVAQSSLYDIKSNYKVIMSLLGIVVKDYLKEVS